MFLYNVLALAGQRHHQGLKGRIISALVLYKSIRIRQKSNQKHHSLYTIIIYRHQSSLPKKSKINFIHNERKCIEGICSTHSTSEKYQQMLDNILRLNGYPENNIEQSKDNEGIKNQDYCMKTSLLTYAYKRPFILENTNQLLTPENAVHLQTYCFNSALLYLTTPTQSICLLSCRAFVCFRSFYT